MILAASMLVFLVLPFAALAFILVRNFLRH